MFEYTPRITKNIIIINIFLFVVSYFTPVDLVTLLGGFYPDSVNFKPYQVISHMFMHGGLFHIFFNMYILYMFGAIVERTLGEKKFFILYSLGGLGSFLLFNFVNYIELNDYKEILLAQGVDFDKLNLYSKLDFRFKSSGEILSNSFNSWIATLPKGVDLNIAQKWFVGVTNPMVGASGAISSVMIAFAVLFPDAKLQLIFPPISFKAKYLIPITIGLDLYLGLKNNPGDNIAHFAHIGGAITGLILSFIWKKNQFRIN
ncbi:MAG: rhomboid family intramembrane serine protease [Solirubrobacteraceae bacterium]